jgi:uncharacterized protein involved in response to NO
MSSHQSSISGPAGLPVGLPVSVRPAPLRRIDPARTPWRFAMLMAAPHRLAFFGGALMLAATALWWAAILLLRNLGVTVPWAVSSGIAHGWLMGFGFMPLFIAGFLFTAGPRWLGLPETPARALLVPVGTIGTGWLMAVAGFHLGVPLASLGLAVVSVGWALAVGRFALMIVESPAVDRAHAIVAAVASLVGALALWAAAASLALRHEEWARAALHFGLWGSPAVVFAAVSHRMIPFFSAAALPRLEAWRPSALLGVFVALVGLQAPLAAADALGLSLPGGLLAARAAYEATAAVFLLWLAQRWGLVQSLRVRLLAMLHLGFVWLGIAFALLSLSHGLQLASGGELTLGLAPLHALTMGYLAGTLLAMATRVSCGHGGRSLTADDWVWAMFWMVQGAAFVRVAAALWPTMATPLTLLAVQAWVCGMVAWAVRYARWYGRVRADGKAG